MRKKCQHKWKLVDKTILESPYTKLTRAGGKYAGSGMPAEFFLDKVVLTFLCEICGEYSIEERGGG